MFKSTRYLSDNGLSDVSIEGLSDDMEIDEEDDFSEEEMDAISLAGTVLITKKGKQSKYIFTERFLILYNTGRLRCFKKKSHRKKKTPLLSVELGKESEKYKFWKSCVSRYCLGFSFSKFLISFEDVSEFNGWMKAFSRFIQFDKLFVSSDLPYFSSISCENWTNENMVQFLDYIPVIGEADRNYGDVETLKKYLVDINFSGTDLLLPNFKLETNILRKIKKQKMLKAFQYSFFREVIFRLKKNQKSCWEFLLVMKKLSLNYYGRRIYFPHEVKPIVIDYLSIKRVCEILSNPRRLYNEYFGSLIIQEESKKSRTEKDEVIFDFSDTKEKKKSKKIVEEEEEEDGEKDTKSRCIVRKRMDDEVVVKLVITDFQELGNVEFLRHLISPIRNITHRNVTPYGLFHTAIIVGPYYFSWDDSGLVYPKEIGSKFALLTLDLGAGGKKTLKGKTKEDVFKNLALHICRWNTTIEYGRSSGNCQQFVNETLSILGVKCEFLEKNGPLKLYLNRMRKFGSCKQVYCPEKDILKVLKGTEILKKIEKNNNEMEFESHAELDMFAQELFDTLKLKECYDFINIFASDYHLLKSFDRSFWLRNVRDPKEKKWEEEREGWCPFGNPFSDGSLNDFGFIGNNKKEDIL